MKPYLLLLLAIVAGQSYAAGDCKAFYNDNSELFYKGECKDGYAHGIGVGRNTYDDGSIMERHAHLDGEWKNGYLRKGIETYKALSYVYTGEFENSAWHGYGVLKLMSDFHLHKFNKKYVRYESGYYVVEGLWNGRWIFFKECSKIECDSSYDPYHDLDLKTKTDIVMNKITTAIKEENYKDAIKYFSYLERVNKNLPESFYFYQIQSLSKSGRLDDAKDKAKDYLKKHGSKGKYYAEVIEIMGR